MPITPDPICRLSDALLEKLYPFIQWREPIGVRSPSRGLERLGCRLCIAQKGLKEREVYGLFKTDAEFREHLAAAHPVTSVTDNGQKAAKPAKEGKDTKDSKTQ